MTDEMAERTLVSVAAVREVVGEEILLARRRAEKAADTGHAERVVA
ncbi:MAG: hypothetical protein Q4B91_03405 [Atopobiaceae bacterium]|nr:hypothetical protein [Atopobiaceae bacterium]